MTNNKNCQLSGHPDFDKLLARLAAATGAAEQQALEDEIWSRFGSTGAVMISDMAGFSSTSRRNGICHYLKLIARARNLIAPVIARNNGVLLKCDADNCYSFFDSVDDAIRTSFEANAAIFAANNEVDEPEQIFLSVGVDYGEVLLVGDEDFFGDPVNTASKLGEDLAIKAETLVTERALAASSFQVPPYAERMVARISDIEIQYVRLPMTEAAA